MNLLIIFLLIASSFAEEVLVFPQLTPEEVLRETFKSNENFSCVEELKDSSDPECQLYLGWGHSKHARTLIEDKFPGSCGIGMGCNSGIAGSNGMKDYPEYWRFQRGSNGTYSNSSYQGTQNGGLNPVIFEPNDYKMDNPDIVRFFDLNSYIGFMRLTQYHMLKLKQFADDQLLGKKCSDVKIQFVCSDNVDDPKNPNDFGDLNDKELNLRFSAWKKKNKIPRSEFGTKYTKEIEIMNRIEPLKGCFNTGSEVVEALPTRCDQQMIVDRNMTMASHCLQWIQEIDKIKEQNWNTPSWLPRPTNYNYPAKGPIY